MQIEAKTPAEYVEKIPEDRKAAFERLRSVINAHLPEGFSESTGYGMIGWAVPHGRYPKGYHCKPSDPLPFMGLASQKHSINLYHMGIYADPQLLEWFQAEFPKHSKVKLDMGKSCIRFKKPEHIPFDLIGELAGKMTVQEWIDLYESKLRR